MRLSQIYNAVIKHFTDRERRINILFYLIAAGVIWYLYSFKVVATLILMILSVFILSSFLLALYTWVRAGFRGIDKDFIYSLLLAIVVLPFAFFTLDKQLLGYVLALSAVTIGIGIYRINW